MAFSYSTQPYLAWCLALYFYGGLHHFYVADCFYPYRLPNPKSSNPLLVYQDLYQPWQDRDNYDKFVLQKRLDIRKGVALQRDKGAITADLADRLKEVCDKIEIMFFYPLVYRVNMSSVPPDILESRGSGLTGSKEYFINGLSDLLGALEVVFLDFSGDRDFDALKSLPPRD
jgi:hypothetical protein